MTSGKLRSRLLFVHRALAIVLVPFLLVLCVSGIVLAFQPLVGEGPRARIDAAQLQATLAGIDPEGSAGLLIVAEDGRSFELRTRGQGVRGNFDLATGKTQPAEEGFDLYEKAEQLHRGLLLGLNPVMETAAFGVLLLVLLGPFVVGRLGGPSLAQRHASLGLLFYPLILLPPLTGVMMVLEIGQPARPPEAPAEQRLSLSRGLELAAPRLDLARLAMARRWPSGEILVYLAPLRRGELEVFKVDSQGDAASFSPPRNWPHDLHEGRAFHRGSILNMAGAVSLLFLMGSGLASFWRSWRRRRRPAASS